MVQLNVTVVKCLNFGFVRQMAQLGVTFDLALVKPVYQVPKVELNEWYLVLSKRYYF